MEVAFAFCLAAATFLIQQIAAAAGKHISGGVVTDDTLKECGSGCVEDVKRGNESFQLFLGTNQSVYRIGDVVLGVGERWERDRESVATSPEFAGTLLQTYFKTRVRWEQHEMDFKRLADLCDEMVPKAVTQEDLVIHLRNGDDVHLWHPADRVTSCAEHFNATHPRKRTDPKLRVRLVTVQHYGRNEQHHFFFPSPGHIREGNEAVKKVRPCAQCMGG